MISSNGVTLVLLNTRKLTRQKTKIILTLSDEERTTTHNDVSCKYPFYTLTVLRATKSSRILNEVLVRLLMEKIKVLVF